jgi:glycine oxidase
MAASPDVVVIGAGIIGCAIARELARGGALVQVFESRTIGAGATQASAGVLAPYIEAGHGGPLFELTIRSLGMYGDFVREVAEDSGIAIEYRRCGTLEVAIDDETAARFRQHAEASGGTLQWLDAEATHREAHALAPVRGALLAPDHGYVDAPLLTEALAWAAMRHDARIETGRRVEAVEPEGSRVTIRTADGTAASASTVVVAAGSWSSDSTFTHLRPREAVRPVRGQLLRLRTDTALSRILWGPDCYIVPRDKGMVLVGATVEDVGFDERTTAAGVRDLLDAACELVPELWRASFVDARAGLRPATTSGLPIIERSAAAPNVIYATGHFRNGVLLAPLTAHLVADLVRGNGDTQHFA